MSAASSAIFILRMMFSYPGQGLESSALSSALAATHTAKFLGQPSAAIRKRRAASCFEPPSSASSPLKKLASQTCPCFVMGVRVIGGGKQRAMPRLM